MVEKNGGLMEKDIVKMISRQLKIRIGSKMSIGFMISKLSENKLQISRRDMLNSIPIDIIEKIVKVIVLMSI